MSESTAAHVRRAYDAWAATYDTDENPTRDLNAYALRQGDFDLAGKVVLEIGCGTGLNTQWLAERARRVVAVDLSERMLARARRRVGSEKARFFVADVTKPWSIDGDSCDLVVANLVLEHVKDVEHVFSEAWRVLHQDGRFYVGELHPYKQLQGTQARYHDPESGEEVHVPAFLHRTSEFVNAAIEAGFLLRRMDEWHGQDEEVPRLLTLLFHR